VNHDSLASELTQPRLGIVHLLVWMTGSAAILAAQRALGEWENHPLPHRAFYLTMAFAQSMVSGALVGSLAVGVGRRLQRRRFPVHPGQWIALLWGAMVVVLWLDVAAFKLVSRDTMRLSIDDPLSMWQFGSFAVVQLLTAAGCLGIALMGPWERRWRVLLVMLAAETGLSGLCTLAVAIRFQTDFMSASGIDGFLTAINLVQMIGGLVNVAILSLCVTVDLGRRVRRDWMHYVGVAAVLWNAASGWAYTLGGMALS